jgi:transposase
VGWATAALDKVRREVWNEVRRSGQKAEATEIKDSRWALLKNPRAAAAARRASPGSLP